MHRFKSCLDSNAGPTGRQAEDMEKTFDVSFAGLNKSATLREIVDTLRCLVAFRNDRVPFSFNNWMQFAVGKSQQHSTFQSIHYLNENLVNLVTIESDLTKDTYIATALASSTCTSATFKSLIGLEPELRALISFRLTRRSSSRSTATRLKSPRTPLKNKQQIV